MDLVPRAIRKARRRAGKADAKASFVLGDVTALQAAGVGSGFRFVWDFGTLHGLTQAQREAVGREVSAVTVPGATMLMLAWAPGHRGPLPCGASRADIGAAFSGWEVIGEESFDASGLPPFLRNVDPRCYRLLRE